jgi:hypothetical protein
LTNGIFQRFNIILEKEISCKKNKTWNFFHISENNIISVKAAKVLWYTKFNCSPIGLTGLFIYSGCLPQAEPVPTGALQSSPTSGFALGR